MKIGLFDSGLGGLIIANAVIKKMPDYDYVYLGDTLNLPYGGKSTEIVYNHSLKAVDYLFSKQNCNLIIIACNTATVCALRRLQQEYLPKHYPNRRILGVVIPTIETIIEKNDDKIGVLATQTTVKSDIYKKQLSKLTTKKITVVSQAAPLLVPMIEYDGVKWIEPVLKHYLKPLIKENIESLLLGCTHYPYLKDKIRKILPDNVDIISQDEIIPDKLLDYLRRHPEIESKITKNKKRKFLVTDLTEDYVKNAKQLYGSGIKVEKVSL